MIVGNEVISGRRARIWVLITDGESAKLCSCQDGTAVPIAPFFKPSSSLGEDLRAFSAWFKAEGQTRLCPSLRRQHLLHMSQLLREAAREGAYDGLVIIAAAPIAAELEDALSPETRALLIGKVISHNLAPDTEGSPEQRQLRH